MRIDGKRGRFFRGWDWHRNLADIDPEKAYFLTFLDGMGMCMPWSLIPYIKK
ncbi:hypothetical protein C943_04537 [Mariniradius saccharolyticus AK6]|uniref:Uncharacterized protein n=1 Tax=Mariniradius saccharolyticus AK6 TaxID=1239962 RepID=M7XGH6_9BACT|nr:hypothetical protein C943_04537 [Mariniradius saccharolyticus AK6]